eukprot:554835-Rhodomonas_salina.5
MAHTLYLAVLDLVLYLPLPLPQHLVVCHQDPPHLICRPQLLLQRMHRPRSVSDVAEQSKRVGRVQNVGRAWGLGLKIQDVGVRVRVKDLNLRGWGWTLGMEGLVLGLGFRA